MVGRNMSAPRRRHGLDGWRWQGWRGGLHVTGCACIAPPGRCGSRLTAVTRSLLPARCQPPAVSRPLSAAVTRGYPRWLVVAHSRGCASALCLTFSLTVLSRLDEIIILQYYSSSQSLRPLAGHVCWSLCRFIMLVHYAGSFCWFTDTRDSRRSRSPGGLP